VHLKTSFEAEMHPWPRDDFGDRSRSTAMFRLTDKIFSERQAALIWALTQSAVFPWPFVACAPAGRL
jgi:hypothetical protein